MPYIEHSYLNHTEPGARRAGRVEGMKPSRESQTDRVMEDWGLTIQTRTVWGWEADPDRGLAIKIGGCMAERPTRGLR